MALSKILPNRDDVFYLTVEELLGLAESNANGASLAVIAAERRKEFATYAEQPDLPRRFETVGAPGLSQIVPVKSDAPVADDPDLRRGLGCSAGIIRGRARVVRDPHGVVLDHGDILMRSSPIRAGSQSSRSGRALSDGSLPPAGRRPLCPSASRQSLHRRPGRLGGRGGGRHHALAMGRSTGPGSVT